MGKERHQEELQGPEQSSGRTELPLTLEKPMGECEMVLEGSQMFGWTRQV